MSQIFHDKAIEIPGAVREVLSQLESAGYEAFAVGGCVRDLLLGRKPADWDITTNARPEEIKDLFKRTVDTGLKHGTVTVLWRTETARRENISAFEITTYRVDGKYEDGRHPKEVRFTSSLIEDLQRRDFTINAMAIGSAYESVLRAARAFEGEDIAGYVFPLKNEKDDLFGQSDKGVKDGSFYIIDAFGGMKDLKNGLICAVGNSEERFSEDALRMLRAIRFSAQLGFRISDETSRAIRILAATLKKVSKERISSEISKIILSNHPETCNLVFDMGLAPFVSAHFPEIISKSSGRHAFDDGPLVSAQVPAEKFIRWGMLLRGQPSLAKTILRELKMDNETIEGAKAISKLCSEPLPMTEYEVRRRLSNYGSEIYFGHIQVEKALARTVGMELCDDHGDGAEKRLSLLYYAEATGRKVLENGDCLHISDLSVKGQDILSAGILPGPHVGRILSDMLDDVLRDPFHNEKSYLMSIYCKE